MLRVRFNIVGLQVVYKWGKRAKEEFRINKVEIKEINTLRDLVRSSKEAYLEELIWNLSIYCQQSL